MRCKTKPILHQRNAREYILSLVVLCFALTYEEHHVLEHHNIWNMVNGSSMVSYFRLANLSWDMKHTISIRWT